MLRRVAADDVQANRTMRVDRPPPIPARDRMLVEWVAQASLGDAIPEPWSYARSPLESIIRTLALLGVIGPPEPGVTWAAIAREAGPQARAWLDAHPRDDDPPAAAAST